MHQSQEKTQVTRQQLSKTTESSNTEDIVDLQSLHLMPTYWNQTRHSYTHAGQSSKFPKHRGIISALLSFNNMHLKTRLEIQSNFFKRS